MGMRVSSGSPSTQAASQGGAAAWQQRQQSLQTLSKAFQSNDLDQAKAAYAAMTGGSSSKAAANTNSPFAQLGKALQSGDLGAAQQAFAAMRSHHGRSSANVPSPSPSPATATTGNHLNVVA
jgi:iron uptake system EfeUOB component EfeO/EfeM